VTSFDQSARSCCAETNESGDSPGGASPQAGRITPRAVWLPLSAASVAPGRRGPDPERSGRRTLLFALQRVSHSSSLPSGNAHLRRRKRTSYTAKTAATTHPIAETFGARAAQNGATDVGVVAHAVELRPVNRRAAGAAGDYGVRGDDAPRAP
jgi:hypothetical protein